jgi:hypothetical protein
MKSLQAAEQPADLATVFFNCCQSIVLIFFINSLIVTHFDDAFITILV